MLLTHHVENVILLVLHILFTSDYDRMKLFMLTRLYPPCLLLCSLILPLINQSIHNFAFYVYYHESQSITS